MKTPMLPYFKLTINDDDETGVYTNAFVDEPAHQKSMHAFGAQKKKRYFQAQWLAYQQWKTVLKN